jgi:hypothetical protein
VAAHVDDAVIRRLYRAIAEETGADLVVDGSKLPPYGLLLGQQPGVEVLVLHLVRDPRATAYSWLRGKPTRDTARGAQMQRQEVWKSSLLWTVWNLTAARVWKDDGVRTCRVRYEDFVADPAGELARVAVMVGADPAELPFVAPDTVRLSPTHSVAGNPNRHDTGLIRLRSDDRWRTAMARRDRLVVTLLTTPALLLFRYPLATRTAAGPGRRQTSPTPAPPARSAEQAS